MISTYLLSGVNPGLYSITSAFAPSIGSIFCITPGRTVAIWGLLSGQAIVAIVFPPNAGRVINNWLCFCSFPGIALNGKSPISRTVQSAVKPVWTRADTRGPRSRPIAVAPTNMISGLYSLITDANACVYGSVLYSFNSGSSTTITLSAPYFARSSTNPLTSEPTRTAVTSVSKSFAKSFAFPSNSNAIPLNSLSTCCAKTYTPLYSSKPILFTTFPFH